MALSVIVILNGLFSILLIIVFLIVGFKIISKYREKNNSMFLLIGFAWIGISEPWWPSAINFLIILFNGKGLSLEMYLVLNNAFLPFFLLFWLLAIANMTEIKRKKILIGLYLLIGLTIEIIMLYLLFTEPSRVGILLSPVDVDFGPITIVHIVFNLSIFMISGFWFSYQTLKLDEPVNKLRGKILLTAFILFLVGAVLETLYTIPPNRIIILLSAITFYIGFMMPERIKIYFIRQ